MRTGADFIRENQDASGKGYGASGMYRAVLGSVGLYDKLISYAGAGASVPLLGFGNTLFKGVKKAVLEDGILGIFMGGFTASAVGISAALIFSYVASLVFRPKMKE